MDVGRQRAAAAAAAGAAAAPTRLSLRSKSPRAHAITHRHHRIRRYGMKRSATQTPRPTSLSLTSISQKLTVGLQSVAVSVSLGKAVSTYFLCARFGPRQASAAPSTKIEKEPHPFPLIRHAFLRRQQQRGHRSPRCKRGKYWQRGSD